LALCKRQNSLLTSDVTAVADGNNVTRYGYTLHVEVCLENDKLCIGRMPSCRIQV